MRGRPASSECNQRGVERAQVSRPDMGCELAEVQQRVRFIEQKLGQRAMSLAQIAADARGHYVAAGVIAATNLRLHMVHRQCVPGVLHAAVDASMRISGKDFFAFHDG
jgi:hypothetical protein